MISTKQKIILTLRSTVNLLAAFAFIMILKWMFILLGAWLSGFHGYVKWEGIQMIASSKTWNQKQVLGIYLFPYLGLTLIYFLITARRRIPLKLPSGWHLFFGWVYTLLLVTVFVIPIGELFYEKGVYYALSWLSFNRIEKILFVLILIILYSVHIFRIAPVFSTSLSFRSYEFIKKGSVLKQLPFLWFIPLLFLLITTFFIHFSCYQNCLLTGLFLTLLVNTPLMANYRVILK